MQLISHEDMSVIVEAIHYELDIIPLLPEEWMEYLRENRDRYKALADADFLIGLTKEILPEYSELLVSRKPWLERQLLTLVETVR